MSLFGSRPGFHRGLDLESVFGEQLGTAVILADYRDRKLFFFLLSMETLQKQLTSDRSKNSSRPGASCQRFLISRPTTFPPKIVSHVADCL